ncbi:hypothetical protein HK098_004343 [Nowakowskiella sp. JEL0407]|nr:hypothetical protein HK098_004343 [Nowakowskiella sp. JEL0407]
MDVINWADLYTFTALDVSKWDWTQLISPDNFSAEIGKTPMYNLQVIGISWVLYFTTILGLKMYMKDRKPFQLKYVTAAHNMFLCFWSLAMCAYGCFALYQRSQELGIAEAFCTSDKSTFKGPLSYVLYTYYLSKYWELLDTVILVLKKKPVIFLHWYHHSIVIIMFWFTLQSGLVFSIQGMIFNTLIHVFMYYYYFLASLGLSVWFKKYLTTGQIIQFMTSFIMSVPYLYYHNKNNCIAFPAFLFAMGINATRGTGYFDVNALKDSTVFYFDILSAEFYPDIVENDDDSNSSIQKPKSLKQIAVEYLASVPYPREEESILPDELKELIPETRNNRLFDIESSPMYRFLKLYERVKNRSGIKTRKRTQDQKAVHNLGESFDLGKTGITISKLALIQFFEYCENEGFDDLYVACSRYVLRLYFFLKPSSVHWEFTDEYLACVRETERPPVGVVMVFAGGERIF